jgi:hypothetical protein
MNGKDNDANTEVNVDDQLLTCTGLTGNEWCTILDAWHGRKDSLAAIAHVLTSRCGVRRLWAQAIAVYYRRKHLNSP